MTVDEFISKYDSKQEFTQEELDDVVWAYSIHEEDIDSSRWTKCVEYIIELATDTTDRYFSICRDIGLTECQENGDYYQPTEVVKVTKMVEVTKYESIKDNK